MNLLGVYPALHGYEFLENRRLDPRLERDTFSGGVNLTIRARNLRRIDDTLKIIRAEDPPVLMGSRFALAAVRAALGHEVTCPASAHPAAIEWYGALHRRLA